MGSRHPTAYREKATSASCSEAVIAVSESSLSKDASSDEDSSTVFMRVPTWIFLSVPDGHNIDLSVSMNMLL